MTGRYNAYTGNRPLKWQISVPKASFELFGRNRFLLVPIRGEQRVLRNPPYRLRGVKRGPPGEGGAGPYATPLRGPTTLPGREKSGVWGAGIMTGETGSWLLE